jgi:CubicO group peptidase (beta-lactamase class C family)
MRNGLLILILIALGVMPCCESNPAGVDPTQHIWDYSTPEAQGMNPEILDAAFVRAGSEGFIDGLLVIRNGLIVGEEYYNGYDQFRPHNVMSVSKSFLSAITGIALSQGYIDSLDEEMLSYFPEYIYADMDSRKHDITVRHLLTMRMGIQDESEDNYGVYWGFYNSDDWIKKTIEAPLVSSPGERMRYNTFQTHLLSAIITKVSERSTLEFAKACLFDPVGIGVDSWEQDPQGYYFGGNSMYFAPQEAAVLGYLYLNNGRLNDCQIIPGDWVELSLSPSTNLDHPNQWGALRNYNYAYLWWIGEINEVDLFMAYGYGGQFVVVFPALDLIVVSTSDYEVDPDASTVQEWAIFDIISAYILPSVSN